MKIKRLILLLLLLFIILPAVLICAVGTVRFCRTADALTGNNVRAVTSLQAQSLEDFFAQRAADLRIFSTCSGSMQRGSAGRITRTCCGRAISSSPPG